MTTLIFNLELSVTIHHKGAELISIKTTETNKEYIWEGKPEYWGKHSPILFPIVGTLKNNSYKYNGENYILPRHGFGRDMFFELVSTATNEAVFLLKSNKATMKLYPFDFELQITYTLQNSELNVTYKVSNNSIEAMYYSIGGHPAFALPNQFENYSLLFESNENLISYQLENDLLSDKTKHIALSNKELPLTYSLFEKDALIFKELHSKKIQLLENGSPILNFNFPLFPNFGLWTKMNAPFICLEPWAGYSDVTNASENIVEKEGIQSLAGHTFKEYSFSIEIL